MNPFTLLSAGVAGAGAPISPAWALPFVILLACIALMPFVHKHHWENHYPKVAIALGLIPFIYYCLIQRAPGPWLHYMQEYISFIILLGSLYIISGGIVIHIARRATPLQNCMLLLFGAVAANLFGTTGASMLLIRPFLRINRGHIKPYHVVFFIFLVSNVGGSLTPVGDPPLFLGYLAGVPFWWVMEHCRPMWAAAVGMLLAVFFVIDTLDHRKTERPHPEDSGPPVTILGIQNLLLILGVVAAVFQEGFFDLVARMYTVGPSWALSGHLLVSREVLMVACGIASLLLTGRHIHEKNEFSFGPLKEVAVLFIGIFSTMVPALQWMQNNASAMPVQTPGQFYFVSGALSSVLDNAPTYKTFLELSLSEQQQENPGHLTLAREQLERMADNKTLELDLSLIHI